MTVIERDLNSIFPYENNPRNNDAAVEYVANSLKAFGWKQPIVIDKDGVIVAGHTRWKAARRLGMTTAPCVVADDLTPDQVKAYRLADNKVAELAEWDFDALEFEMADLDGLFVMTEFGFVDEEEDDETEVEEDDFDQEPPAEPKSKLGDIYQLGRHRLMCGDSTSQETVAKLMEGKKADMVFTDPPYNVNYYSSRGQENKFGYIQNDNMDDKSFDNFCNDFFCSYEKSMKPLAAIYVCHPDAASAPKIAFEYNFAKYFQKSATIIWAKQSAGMGWQDYRSQHEPILYGWKTGNGKHKFYGDRTNSTVWNVDRDDVHTYIHPTQKPIALVAKAIKNSSAKGDTVLDLFGGSGTTLIAAEQTGRDAYIMELDPRYVDVIINRWEQMTGEKAVLLNV